MTSLPHTLFFFLVALVILIAVHEYGHYWMARRLDVKVLRFSLGFGKVIWRRQATPDATEFTLSALPLGGYVRMVDEREAAVAERDLPYAFNRKSVAARSAIVLAGPVFNFLLAILIYWVSFMWGETGARPVIGEIKMGTLAQQAGFEPGDEIISVDAEPTPTWSMAMGHILEQALDETPIPVTVVSRDGKTRELELQVSAVEAEKPEALYKRLGLNLQEPVLEPVVDRVEPGSAAEQAGLMAGDRIVRADGQPVTDWKSWVEYVRARPGQPIEATIERDGAPLSVSLTPRATDAPDGPIGRIGAGVRVPEGLAEAMQVEYRLGPLPALAAACRKTGDYAWTTLKMVGRMLIGRAAVDNLSGPISIAQFAGQSARLGLGQFMKFLALVSISLGVLNLLPIPVLDGGHLMFYGVEALKGSPVSERTQMRFQQIGMFVLLLLMLLGFYLDIGRLFSS